MSLFHGRELFYDKISLHFRRLEIKERHIYLQEGGKKNTHTHTHKVQNSEWYVTIMEE